MLDGHSGTPKLLVSVRSGVEAQAALSGGCDILDIKEPSHGSLGRAAYAVMDEVIQAAHATTVPVSAAMGEVHEWAPESSTERTGKKCSEVLTRLSFMKVGLAEIGRQNDWADKWRQTINSINRSLVSSDSGTGARWVAVAYADWQTAGAPNPDEIVEHVLSRCSETGPEFAGVLIDTWSKNSGRLLDSLNVEQLSELAARIQHSGRLFAVAGRLTIEMLAALAPIRPDVIAVRSAACRNQDRTAQVDADAVRQLRAELQRVFISEPPVPSAAGAGHGQF